MGFCGKYNFLGKLSSLNIITSTIQFVVFTKRFKYFSYNCMITKYHLPIEILSKYTTRDVSMISSLLSNCVLIFILENTVQLPITVVNNYNHQALDQICTVLILRGTFIFKGLETITIIIISSIWKRWDNIIGNISPANRFSRVKYMRSVFYLRIRFALNSSGYYDV